MPYADREAAKTLAHLLTRVLTSSSGSAVRDASRLLSEMEQAGWILIRLLTATDVVELPGGGIRADFGPMVATVNASGHASIRGKEEGEIPPDQSAIAMVSATRWVMTQQLQRGV